MKNIFSYGCIIFYGFLVFLHCFFNQTNLHQRISTTIFFAQGFAFETLVGCVVIIIVCIRIFYKKRKLKQWKIKDVIFSSIYLFFSFCLIFFSQPTKIAKDSSESYHSFKIVELNAQNDLREDAVEEIFGNFDADIVVLPEFGGVQKGSDPKDRLESLFIKQGFDLKNYSIFVSDETSGNIKPITVIIKNTIGNYQKIELDKQTCFGTIYLHETTSQAPDLIGVHTCPPLPFLMDFWKKDLDVVKDLLQQNPQAIVLGDFNANEKHGSFNEITTHVDALNALPFYKRGSWGLFLPPIFRSSIDHVYLPKNTYVIQDVYTKQFQGPDHVGVFVKLSYANRNN